MKNLSISISNDDYKKFGLTKETFSFEEFVSVIENEISVKQMIKVQRYHGIDADILDNITRELNILEPLDELLKSV